MTYRWGLLEVNTSTGNITIGTRTGNFERRMSVAFLFLGGIVISHALMWSAPVHEIAHVIAAWAAGSPAHLVSWTQSWALQPTAFTLWVGYQAETIFVLLLANIAYRRHNNHVTAFMLGAPIAFMFEWGLSSDRAWLLTRGHVGWADSAVIFMILWYIIGLVCLRKRPLAD